VDKELHARVTHAPDDNFHGLGPQGKQGQGNGSGNESPRHQIFEARGTLMGKEAQTRIAHVLSCAVIPPPPRLVSQQPTSYIHT
jgi:hypothetical protein